MKKVLVIIGVIVTISLCIWLFCFKAYDAKVVYPLSKVKNDEVTDWVLCITETGVEEDLLVVSDRKVLYENKKSFKVNIIDDVYWSTPAYFIRVYKNGEEVQSYPLLYLEQIDFGTIQQNLIQ